LVAVAHRVGVNDRTLRSWEAGETRPHRRNARKLAKELGATTDELGLDDASSTAALPSSSP
jgi:ribosome-binding protein aMBF1 (putative translation factor)